MKSVAKYLLVFIVLGSIVYTIEPLFRGSSSRSAVSSSVESSQNTAIETVRSVAQKVGSVFGDGCPEPFHYSIGNIDPRFGIDREDLKNDLAKAESVWEDTTKKDILRYDNSSDFKINLVFDDRQAATLKSKELEGRLETVQSLQNGISKDYDTLSDQYDKKKSQYESALKSYESDADAYESRVAYWNGKGGAPEDEYRKLQQDKEDLDDTASALEKQRKSLNVLVEDLNALVRKEKKVVNGYNRDVATYESEYGGGKAFDQGVYTGTEIDIYQFDATDDLVLVLAHEFGHALGMEHVENPKSIMYYLMSQQDIEHPVPSAEDMAALDQTCS